MSEQVLEKEKNEVGKPKEKAKTEIKFYASSKDFLKAVHKVSGAVSKKSTILELLNVLIEVEEDKAYISATDLEIGIKTELSCSVDETGEISINARVLEDLLKTMPDCEIVFEVDSAKKIQIYASDNKIKTKFKIHGVSKEDFPEFPKIPETEITIGKGALKDAIKKTISNTSKDDTRYFLKGVCFELNTDEEFDGLRMVATDGKRLAFVEKSADLTTKKSRRSIVPTKILENLAKTLTSEGSVEIAFGETNIFFTVPGTMYVSNLLEGNFPDWSQVVPEKFSREYVFETENLIKSVERVSNLADKRSYQTIFSFDVDLSISAFDDNGNSAVDEVDILSAHLEEDGGFKTAFNYSFLLEALRNIETEEVEMFSNAPESPVKVRCKTADGEDTGYFYIVMPMKITKE